MVGVDGADMAALPQEATPQHRPAADDGTRGGGPFHGERTRSRSAAAGPSRTPVGSDPSAAAASCEATGRLGDPALREQ
jgi:hypothetical protein